MRACNGYTTEDLNSLVGMKEKPCICFLMIWEQVWDICNCYNSIPGSHLVHCWKRNSISNSLFLPFAIYLSNCFGVLWSGLVMLMTWVSLIALRSHSQFLKFAKRTDHRRNQPWDICIGLPYALGLVTVCQHMIPSKSSKCLIHNRIGPYASIVVMSTEYTIDRTRCNYVCFN